MNIFTDMSDILMGFSPVVDRSFKSYGFTYVTSESTLASGLPCNYLAVEKI